jgi:putative endopeptidase
LRKQLQTTNLKISTISLGVFKQMHFPNILRTAGAALVLAAVSATTFAQSKAFDISHMDRTADACADFFQFANGTWVKNTQIPGDRASYGSFDMLIDSNQQALHDILETAAKNTSAKKGSSEQLISDMYASCMNEDAIEKAGTAPIDPYLKQIDKINSAKDLQTVIARMHRDGIPGVFRFGDTIDAKNSNLNIASVSQGGLSLPNRDYYLDARFKEIRDKYVVHVTNMFVLLGEYAAKAKADADTVMRLQTRLATASKSRLELRDPDKNYNKIAPGDLQKITPNFDWNAYIKERGAPAVAEVNVGQPKFFEEVNRMMTDVSLADWKTYLRWMTVNDAANALPKRFDSEHFNFYSKTLSGVQEQEARWKRCSAMTDGVVGEALGAEYVKKAFTPEAKKRMNELIDNLFAVYRERIQNLDWMSPATKEKALIKLNAYKRKIGYSDNPRGYAGLTLDRKSYFDNLIRFTRWDINRDLQDIGKPVDKTRWIFTPPTVNAGYIAQYNEIDFPAGILQPPFFNFAADDAINYGAIGAVIGHEITHGFDDKGSKYDAEGNLKPWWTDEDRKKFDEKTSCVSDQFSEFEVLPGVKINGPLTLGENLADLGGLTLAYNAFMKSQAAHPQPSIDGFTPAQRFFLGYAQVWASKYTDESLKLQVQNDVHANARFRVNAPLANLPYFAEAWGCKVGDKMVREKRCQIW